MKIQMYKRLLACKKMSKMYKKSTFCKSLILLMYYIHYLIQYCNYANFLTIMINDYKKFIMVTD